jgi:hypothetical protein
VRVPRDPREIQLEIDAARESLAATLDQLAHRTSPKRVAAQGKSAALRFLQSPPGIAVVSGIGLLLTVGAVRKARHRKGAKGAKGGKRRR